MLRLKSIRSRLLLWYATVLVVIIAGLSLFLYFSLEQSLEREADRLVLDKSVYVSGGTDFNAATYPVQFEKLIKPSSSNLFAQITNLEGVVLGKSLNLDEPLPVSARSRQEALFRDEAIMETVRNSKGEVFRVATYPKWNEKAEHIGVAQVGFSLTEGRRSLRQLLWWILIAAPVAFVVALLGGWLLINRFLRPLATITRTARQISADGLARQRLPLEGTEDELGSLAQSFNQMLDKLERTFTLQQRFAADAAHELRTPLTAMRGEIEVTLRRPRSEKEYRETLQSNLEEIERLTRLTNNLLTLARADAGEPIAYAEPFDLSLLCREVFKKFEPPARDKGVEMDLDCEDGVLLFGGLGEVERALGNLIENAIKHTPRGESVRIVLERAEGQIRLIVSDTGLGIPKEDLAYIFERFYRVDRARARQQGGAGLGLSIVKAIVEAHGGTIQVTSDTGQGTVFTILLPAGQNFHSLRASNALLTAP